TGMHQRQPGGDDHAAGSGDDFLELPKRHLLEADREEHVLAAVPGDREFGEAEDGNLAAAAFVDGGQDVRQVGVPVEGRLVECGGGDAEEFHVIFSTGRNSWMTSIGPTMAALKEVSSSAGIQYSRRSCPPTS